MLRRAAFSPNIKERADCSAARVHRRRRAAGPGREHPGPPGLDAGVGAGRHRRFGRPDDASAPGDQVILNDPFAGGTHLNDITVVAPCFVGRRRSRLLGWVANRAHHADVGGAAPGSLPADAIEICARRACASPRCGSPPRCGPWCWPTPAPPTSGRATSTPRSGPTRWGCDRLADVRRRAASPRCSTTASGACGRCCADLPDGTWRFADVIDSFGPGARPAGRRRRSPWR